MAPLHFPLFLTFFVFCLNTSHLENGKHMNSLDFVNSLRKCSMESKYHGIKLPELSSYTKTTNSVVNSVVEDEYTTFWQILQKQGYETDLEQLLLQSKGACLVKFDQSAYDPDTIFYKAESKVLRPLFAGPLKAPFLKCFNLSLGNSLDCITKVVKNCEEYGALEKEMIICAVKFLNISVYVYKTSFHKFSPLELDSLRSNDRAVSCIRNWDRYASIARILFLTFFLNARKIISHLTEDYEDSTKIASIQTDIGRILHTEFPRKMIKEVRREKIATSSITFIDAMSRHKRIVNEVRLWYVKSPRKTIDRDPNVYVDGYILYFSVEEQIGEWSSDSVNSILEALIEMIIEGNWNMTSNPMSLDTAKLALLVRWQA